MIQSRTQIHRKGGFDFLLSAKLNWSYVKNILSLSSFITRVNVTLDFEAQKSTSIHHKSNPYPAPVKAFWSEEGVFLQEKYPYL